MSDHYTIISADCHAGGSHAQYREFLDPEYRDDFDAWRGEYKNPFRDLHDGGRVRNWDDDIRNADLEAEGIAGEVIFPNTVPPFFPSFVLFVGPPKPEDYEHRLAGIRAHNRWLVDFCERFPERRAGVGQIFVNDIDDAIEDVKWNHEHGLRGGALIPNIAPDVDWVKPYIDPRYDPLWEVCEDLGVPVMVHGGTGLPNHGPYMATALLYVNEAVFYGQRPLVQFITSGVFERFPDLKFVMTEAGGSWLPGLVENLDMVLRSVRETGRLGELRFDEEHVLPRSATEYVQRNLYLGISQPTPSDRCVLDVLDPSHVMWGADYPHREGTAPFTKEHLRQVFHDMSEDTLRTILGGAAAELYGFDLDALAPIAEQVGPTVAELRQPLTELPDEPNEALERSAKQLATAS
ncbi:MAG: amidohydrolase family protein [Acidimicrobiales bacterium]|nr:amidohydrolase family protein [Acidimicrobiales bacterium]